MGESAAWRVEFNVETCSMCEVCVHLCPTGALLLRKSAGIEQILFDYRLCDGCKGEPLCQKKCPESAASITQVLPPTNQHEPVVLIEGEMAVCRKCGAIFGTARWLDVVIKKTKMDPDAVKEMCPACRRKRLLSTYLDRTGKNR